MQGWPRADRVREQEQAGRRMRRGANEFDPRGVGKYLSTIR